MPDQNTTPTSESAYALLSDVAETKSAVTPPWYYNGIIKLAKPAYRFILWRRYKQATQAQRPVADYQFEIDTRFGRDYPDPPVLPKSAHTYAIQTSQSFAGSADASNQPSSQPSNQSSNQQSTSSLNDHDSEISACCGIDTESGSEAFFESLEALEPATQLHNTDHTATSSKYLNHALCNTTIWCHAVSLGETNTIAPMLKRMLALGAKIWITNTTQTGFARTQKLFTEALTSKQMVHSFVPVDDRAVVERFVNHVKPDLAMFVETELWVNILTVLTSHGIPSVLVNGRLSASSYERYAKFSKICISLMNNITLIIAQDADSAKRFRQLGASADKIRLADSLKWSTGDATSNAQPVHKLAQRKDTLIESFAINKSVINRPIWVAGSTHEGEEAIVLQAHLQLLAQTGLKNSLLLLVPRHPERFDSVAKLIESYGFDVVRRSQDHKIQQDTQVYLVDTMGELSACYELSNVAFVGGSLVDIGGHNPIEASSLATPVIMGSYTQSCHELVAELHQAGALKVVEETNDKAVSTLAQEVSDWLLNADEAKQAGKMGQTLVDEKSSAMTHQLEMIGGVLLDHQLIKQSMITDDNRVDFDHFEVRKNGKVISSIDD